MSILPRELAASQDVGFTPQNLSKLRDNPKKKVAVSQLHVGRYAATLLLKGELTTDGILYYESEEYGGKYSFGIRLEAAEDAAALNALVDDYLEGAVQEDEEGVEWNTLYPIKDDGDVLYLKCKTTNNNTAFAFTSNLKLNPKKPTQEVFRFMPISVEVMVGAYFNLENNTRGIYFTIRHIEFKKPTDLRDTAVQTESSPAPVPSTPQERYPKRAGASGPTPRTNGKAR